MVYNGTAEVDAERMFPDLLAKGVPGADKITLDEFKHLSSLVRRGTPGCHSLTTPPACCSRLPAKMLWHSRLRRPLGTEVDRLAVDASKWQVTTKALICTGRQH